jgi:dipeptidyl aminopeptidase/acylaminoacyl peptidase
MPAVPPGLATALQDRYRLERELGQGGMATVYLAHDLKHDRDVALKILRPDLAAVLGRERFLAEIRLTAKLDHPHILTLIDSGESNGLLWYVVPFIRGESLRQKLQREMQLGLDEALAITKQVAGALEYAHQHGVIHRDLKPENILLHEGEAMLADFGIALAVKEAGGNRLTETGLSLGTPQYMSPEQATGDRQLDARSDVYSLGAVLYEMLAGEPPHTGATVQAVIAKLMTERPTRLRTVRDTVPEGIDAAVARALAKVPADRYGSAAELAAALERGEVPRRLSRRQVAVTLGLLLVLGAGAVGTFLIPRRPPTVPVVQRQLTYTGRAGQPAISPDAKRVAYVTSNRSLVVQPLGGGDPVTLVPPARFLFAPRWTDDGSAILFTMFRDTIVAGRIKLAATWMIPSAGGPAREVLADISPFDAGPDTLTAVWAQRRPWRIEVVELVSHRIVRSIPLADSIGEIQSVAWSPDRNWIAFEARYLGLVASHGGEVRLLVRDGRNPRWAPSGEALYFLQQVGGTVELRKVAVDPRTGARRGEAEPVMSLPRATEFDLGSDGSLVYTQGTNSEQAVGFRLRDGRLEDTRPLTQGTASVGTVGISRDGGRVAYSRSAGGKSRIEVVSSAGGQPQPSPSGSAHDEGPSWSPDGTQVAFISTDSGGAARLMVARYPGGVAQAVGTAPPRERAAWSADGKRIAYGVRDRTRLAFVNLAEQTEAFVRIPDSLGTTYGHSILSPDGSQLAVSTIRKWTDWGRLLLVTADGSSWRSLPEPFGESNPIAWTEDGWLYLSNHRALFAESGLIRRELWRLRVPDGPAELVTALPDGVEDCSLSADARSGACIQPAVQSDLLVVTGLPREGR